MACAWATDVPCYCVTCDAVCDLPCNIALRVAQALTLARSLCSYDLDFKNPDSAPESKITGAALADMYRSFIQDYPIVSIEDPFDQDDFDSYTSLTASVKEQIVRL
jgi:enolase